MKAVLISIRPQWCEKIASGEKTIEVRKTRPKLETPSCSILKLRLSELGTKDQGYSSSASQMWPTPTARDCKGANSMEHLTQPKMPGNSHHVCQLANAVKLFTTPCAADAQGSHGGNNHRRLRTDVAGQLNPTWVEWLMGFTQGWTESNASETL